MLGEQGEEIPAGDRFAEVSKLEAQTAEERFAFWQQELSRCIRCNACRNVCPACSCEKCVFDNPKSGVANKAAADPFEENLFHIIRAFHVAGRCTDCGECSRVCPQHIPLHLLNRKFIKDINELYGPYMAGSDLESKPALLTYDTGGLRAVRGPDQRRGAGMKRILLSRLNELFTALAGKKSCTFLPRTAAETLPSPSGGRT